MANPNDQEPKQDKPKVPDPDRKEYFEQPAEGIVFNDDVPKTDSK